MKFLACFLFVSMFVLALSCKTNKTKTGEYQLMEKPLDGFKPKPSTAAYYKLDLENKETDGEMLSDSDTQINSKKTCEIVKCYPKRRNRQVCICKVWSK